MQAPSEPQTPTLSAGGSDANSTQPTTPSSAPQRPSTRPQSQSKPSKPAVPVVPVLPVVPRQPAKDDVSRPSELTPKSEAAPTNEPAETPQDATETPEEPARSAPKSWADLVRSRASAKAASAQSSPATEANGLVAHQRKSLADVLTNLGDDVSQYGDKVAFLEPRGLVNTGNMCYMNSVSYHFPVLCWFINRLTLYLRCSKYWFPACLSIAFWTILVARPFIASRATFRWSIPCKLIPSFPNKLILTVFLGSCSYGSSVSLTLHSRKSN